MGTSSGRRIAESFSGLSQRGAAVAHGAGGGQGGAGGRPEEDLALPFSLELRGLPYILPVEFHQQVPPPVKIRVPGPPVPENCGSHMLACTHYLRCI